MSKLSFDGSEVEIRFTNRIGTLSITAPVDAATGLAAPVRGLMDGRIEESMTSVINLTLTERGTGRIIFSGEGRNGSIEIFGDTTTLMPR